MACHRRAWLTLGGRRLELEDERAGYVCPELDLGWPEIRDVVTNRPDTDGTDDRTRLFGSRVISAHITAMGTVGTMTIDEIARLFGPFLVPSARPELHYVLDTPGDGYAERVIRMRAARFSAPIAGPWSRSITLGWVAPDPVIWDATEQSVIARPQLTGVSFGRRYDLRFDRVYPAGGGGYQPGYFTVRGDLPAPLRIVIVGPVDGPQISVYNEDIAGEPSGRLVFQFWFEPTFRIDATRWVEIDTRARTVVRDNGENVLSAIRWSQNANWPYAMPAPSSSTLTVSGTNMNFNTQAIAHWRDGFLS